jgi:DNA-binding NarL/FixJ family response regulator
VIPVTIADDHPPFREGMRKALSIGADFQLVGKAADGKETLGSEELTDVLVLTSAGLGRSRHTSSRSVAQTVRKRAIRFQASRASLTVRGSTEGTRLEADSRISPKGGS